MHALRLTILLSTLTAAAPVVAGSPAAPTPAAEAAALDRVVVSARKKSEVLQEVPLSVSALDAAALRAQGIDNLQDLADRVAGLQLQELPLSRRLTLRGVNSGDNTAFEQAVGTYVDGLYRGRMHQQQIGLFDLERVEVLHGPQVALYGNSSIGGAISAVTEKPGFSRAGVLRYGYETQYQQHQAEAAANLPLGERLALRAAGRWSDQREGILPNDASGESEPRQGSEALRLGALWLASDDWTLALRHEQGRYRHDGHIFDLYKHVDGHGNPWPGSVLVGLDDGRLNIGNGAPFKYTAAFQHTDMAESLLDAQYAPGGWTLSAVTGVSRYDYRQSSDVDITPATLINIYQDESYRQFSQELRVANESGGGWDYLVGLYYQDDHLRNDYLADFNLPALVAPVFAIPPERAARLLSPFARHILLDQDSEQRAVFGNLGVEFGGGYAATLGWRYQRSAKRALQAVRTADLAHVDGPGALVDTRWLDPALAPLLLGNPDYLADPTRYLLTLADGRVVPPALAPNHPLGYALVSLGRGVPHEFPDLRRRERHPMLQASLSYRPAAEALVYLNWSNGAKAGGFDFLYEGGLRDEVEYADERASVFELGLKRDWTRLRLNLAVFRGDYRNLQVSVYDGGIGFVVGNAASSISQGIDGELLWQASEQLRVLGRVAYLDFRYAEFRNANCSTSERLNTGAALCDWSGDQAPFVPRFEGMLGLEHRIRLAGWRLRQQLGWHQRSSHATASDNEAQTRQSGYGLLDYRVELAPERGAWQLALAGRNLTNRQYNVFTSVIPLAPGGAFASVRPPGRQLSLEFELRF